MNLLDFIYPKKCVGCSKFGIYLCINCSQNILQTDLVCPFCEKLSIGGLTHPVCIRKYGLDGLWSLGIYHDPLRKAIQKLKYKWVSEIADSLVDLLITYWAKNPPMLLDQIKKDRGVGWIITPIPLHKRRENWRGFNQSALLGKIFAKKLGLKYLDLLIRVKNTKSQVGLKSFQRRANVKGAFSLTKHSILNPKNLILIDDVWTTGSTLKEACFVLKKSGVKKVWALTLAR